MSRTLPFLVACGLLCAQYPPKVLRITREDIKEGKTVLHEQSEAKFSQAMARHKFPVYYLGLDGMTGTPQAWFMESYESFASISDAIALEDKVAEFGTLSTLDSEYHSGSRVWFAVYRPDLSFHSAEFVAGLPKARYMNVITVQIHFEHDLEFAEIAKTAIEAAEKAKSDQPVAVYQVVSGMPAGTYMLLEPAASLNALDDAPARSRALTQAMGESGSRKFLKNAGEVIAGEEPLLFAINPKTSYVSKEFSAGDPEFWTPKPPHKK